MRNREPRMMNQEPERACLDRLGALGAVRLIAQPTKWVAEISQGRKPLENAPPPQSPQRGRKIASNLSPSIRTHSRKDSCWERQSPDWRHQEEPPAELTEEHPLTNLSNTTSVAKH